MLHDKHELKVSAYHDFKHFSKDSPMQPHVKRVFIIFYDLNPVWMSKVVLRCIKN
jgi:hypothetical protein